jgi:hypothetical protein
MKKQIFSSNLLSCLLVMTIFFLTACKKITVSDMLPPATQSGANTFGVLVNERPWTAGASPWGNAGLNATIRNSSSGYIITINANGKHDMMILHLTGVSGPGSYSLDKDPSITMPRSSYNNSFIDAPENFAWYAVDDDNNSCCGCWAK